MPSGEAQRFSSRVPQNLKPNPMARALRAARAASRELLDLTASNPTVAGFVYPDALLHPLESPAGLVYDPSPLGHDAARAAVARAYERRGASIPADRIVLTASTSEAYSILFKLLCEPSDDDVLTPAPSYPLFEHLTRLDGVSPVSYPLVYHGRWSVDVDELAAAWTPRTRAVLAVSPNNPTGSCLSPRDAAAIVELCAARGAALIVDEVFADYPLEESQVDTAPAPGASCLTFRLGGLSKSVGLPQLKLGWIVVDGPEDQVADALDRLEFIGDAYLSVSTPVQLAAPRLIDEGAAIRRQILERVRGNYARLRQACRAYPAVEVLHGDAGWSAVVRVPAGPGEDELVLELVERDGVVVHPGFFFDFPSEAFLVLSLLPPPATFDEGVARVLRRVAR